MAGPLAVARSLVASGGRAGASLFGALGFGVLGNRQPEMGPLFTAYGVDRTLGGGPHALDPLDGSGFQRNLDKIGAGTLPVVEGIYTLYSNAFAQLRPHHKRVDLETGAVTEIATSPAARLLIQPNAYESGATLFSRIACDWLAGEALVVAMTNGREEPDALHLIPRGTWTPRIDPVTRGVFYFASADEELLFEPTLADVIEGRLFVVPARNALHLRWRTPRHPLVGESPFVAAGLAAGVNIALSRTQLLFVENMRRVSQVLTTEQALTSQQMGELREAFDQQAAKWATGGVPILGRGLKMSSADLSAMDESVITALRFSNEEVARCAGVPPPMYGDLSAGAIVNSETLVRHWLSVSLGGLIERLERELDRLFRMDGRHDLVEMSTEALLRSDLAGQADAFAKLVQGGVYTPDEARAQLGRGPAEGGGQLFVQRQMVPVTLAAELAQAELDRLTAPPPPPPPPPEPSERPPLPAPAPDTEQALRALVARVAATESRAERIEDAVDRVGALASAPALLDATMSADGVLHLVQRSGPPLVVTLADLPALVAAAASSEVEKSEVRTVARVDAHVARALQELGLAPEWKPAAAYAPGAIVSCYIGRTYRLREGVRASIGQEPGEHADTWERLGVHGLRVLKSKPARLEAGDLFTEADARFVFDGVTTTLLAPKGVKPSDVERALKPIAEKASTALEQASTARREVEGVRGVLRATEQAANDARAWIAGEGDAAALRSVQALAWCHERAALIDAPALARIVEHADDLLGGTP
jgi:HK97 family phage portal protein